MTELSPRAKELMRRASRGGGPTEGQRRLLKKSVMAAVLLPTVAGAFTLKLVVVGFMVAAVGTGATMAALRSQRPAAPRVERTVAAPPVPESPPGAIAAAPLVLKVNLAAVAPAAEVVAEPRPRPRVVAPSAPAAPTADRLPSVLEPETAGLAREMESLDRAVRALEAERFDEGLLEARAFLRVFPASEFAIEVRVVEVLALCGLSRTAEARAAATNLPTASGNPAVRRLQDSCIWSEPQ